VLVAIMDGLILQWHGHRDRDRLEQALMFASSMVDDTVTGNC
jgi:hypothetical protein